MKSYCSPPLLSGQSVGGALTSAKSAMSSWFSTLAQPAAVTTPEYPEPATEVQPWNQTSWSSVSDSVLWSAWGSVAWELLLWRRNIQKQVLSLNHPHVRWPWTGRQRCRDTNCTVHIHCEAETASALIKTPEMSAGCIVSDRLFVLLDAFSCETLKMLLLGFCGVHSFAAYF